MYFAEWLERYRRRREQQHARDIGYRFGDAPTCEEMAQVGRAAVDHGTGIGAQPAPSAGPVNSGPEQNSSQ
jgi:hypothetical protein